MPVRGGIFARVSGLQPDLRYDCSFGGSDTNPHVSANEYRHKVPHLHPDGLDDQPSNALTDVRPDADSDLESGRHKQNGSALGVTDAISHPLPDIGAHRIPHRRSCEYVDIFPVGCSDPASYCRALLCAVSAADDRAADFNGTADRAACQRPNRRTHSATSDGITHHQDADVRFAFRSDVPHRTSATRCVTLRRLVHAALQLQADEHIQRYIHARTIRQEAQRGEFLA